MDLTDGNYRTIMMKPIDNVAVALQDIPANTEVTVSSSKVQDIKIKVSDQISFGHKFAVKEIKKGDNILKYGEVIGRAVNDIKKGEHVHVHNLEGTRGRGDKVGRD